MSMALRTQKRRNSLPSEANKKHLPLPPPEHIAIIMDGNGRWAGSRKLPRLGGHRRGAENVRNIAKRCRELGVKVLTLYAFSEENWKRPKQEINALMKLLKMFLVSERKLLQKNDIRLRVIGNVQRLPQDVQKVLEETLSLSKDNQSMSLVLALSYGGRDEITRAVRKIAEDIKTGLLEVEEISSDTIESRLDTADFPDPELLIRTSGEMRTSNFLPWQSIYTELYLTKIHWPEFDVSELQKAIDTYHQRERRFGQTTAQIQEHKLQKKNVQPPAKDEKWAHAQ